MQWLTVIAYDVIFDIAYDAIIENNLNYHFVIKFVHTRA